MSKCQKCKAEIIFAKTEAGKWTPVDAKPNPDGKLVRIEDLPDGTPVVKVVDLFTPRSAERLMAHWGTCTDPDYFRGRSER